MPSIVPSIAIDNANKAAEFCHNNLTRIDREEEHLYATMSSNNGNHDDNHEVIAVGRLVEVASRTWPGINKPGGVARVIDVNHDNEDKLVSVNVHYILGSSKEKNVPVEYVKLAPQYETLSSSRSGGGRISLRDRSCLLGRCRRCGSLRTDCGSCDWVMEEQEQRTAGASTAVNTKKETASSTNKSRKINRRRKQTRRKKSTLSSSADVFASKDSSSDSSDSENDGSGSDDDVLLEELLKESRNRFRKHKRKHAKFNAIMGFDRRSHEDMKKNTEKSKATKTSARRETNNANRRVNTAAVDDELESASSSSSEEDIEDILRRNQRHYSQFRRHQNRKNRLFMALTSPSLLKSKSSAQLSSSASSRRWRSFNHKHKSVLELATRAPPSPARDDDIVASAQRCNAKKKWKKIHQKDVGQNHSTIPSKTDGGDGCNDTEELQQMTTQSNEGSSSSLQNTSPVGVAEDSSDDDDNYNMSQTLLDDDDDPDDAVMILEDYEYDELSPHQPVNTEDYYDETLDPYVDENDMITLSQFIQPEGQEAVDNLPQDIEDKTKTMPFHELPNFFDTMATQIEYEFLPDFKIKCAELQSELHRNTSDATFQRAFRSRNNDSLPSQLQQQGVEKDTQHNSKKRRQETILALLDKCHDCWTALRQELIRNGTDQCRAAFRRMNSDSLYKKNKCTLTKEQRKHYSPAFLDVRSLRMDSIEDATETLVRKLRSTVDSCEQYKYDLDIDLCDQETNSEDRASSLSSEDDGSDSEAQDCLPCNSHDGNRSTADVQTDDVVTLDPSERPLAPFDPHMHATRKKRHSSKAKRQHVDALPSSISRRNTTAKRQKTGALSTSLHNFVFARRQKRRHGRASQSNTNKLNNPRSSAFRPSSKIPNHTNRQGENSEEWNEQVLNDMHATFETDENMGPEGVENNTTEDTNEDDVDDQTPPTFNLFDDGDPIDSTTDGSNKHGRRRSYSHRNRSRMALKRRTKIDTDEKRSNNPRDRQQPIVQRMLAFLDANSGNGQFDPGDDSEITDKRTNPTAARRRSTDSRQGDMQRDINRWHSGSRKVDPGSGRGERDHVYDNSRNTVDGGAGGSPTLSSHDSDIEARMRFAPIDIDEIFHRLGDNKKVIRPIPSVRVNIPISLNIGDIPRRLKESYYHSSPHQKTGSLAIYDMLRSSFEQGELAGSALLPKFFEHLRINGRCTIQEMISLNRFVMVKAHVRLLAECVRVLKVQHESTGSRGEAIVFQESQGLLLKSIVRNPRPFYDWLLLQLVEALYALLIPEAWGRVSMPLSSSQMLRILSPLRDALAKVMPLTEHVCVCVLTSLECQKWRRGITEGHAFISSIDPQGWNSFWETGAGPKKPGDLRLERIGKLFPRVEVNALWGILAYVGGANSSSAATTLPRWQLISRIFSCGVLAGEKFQINSKEWLPPSEAQLVACRKEIGYFTGLLAQGTLDALHTSDGVVTKLIRRSLELQSDVYFGNERARARYYPMLSNEKSTQKIISRLWKASHPLFFLPKDGEDNPIVEYQACDSFALPSDFESADQDHPRLKTLFAPTSDMLTGTLKLLCTWIPRIPAKKARQNRLGKSLQNLQKELLDLAKEAEAISMESAREAVSEDSFAAAFSQCIPSRGIGGKAAGRRAIFLREAAAYLFLVEILSRTNSTPQQRPILSHIETIQLWDIIALPSMKNRQKKVFEGVSEAFEDKLEDGDSVQLFVAAKLMGCAALVHLNVSPWNLNVGTRPKRINLSKSSTPSEEDKKSLTFALSCVCSCLDCLCDLSPTEFHVMGYLYSIITLIFTNLTGLVITGGDSIRGRQGVRDMSHSVLLPILERCFKVHLGSSLGENPETFAFRFLYGAIRGVHSFLAACAGSSSEVSNSPRRVQALREAETKKMVSSTLNKSLGPEDDVDIWGSIDDDLLAAIDIPEPNSSNKVTIGTSDNSLRKSLWSCLTTALGRCKPSERYAITSSDDTSMTMSIHGIHSLSQDVDKVCDCLVSAIVGYPKDRNVQDLLQQLTTYIWGGHKGHDDADKDDEQFDSQVAQRLSEELCVLSAKFDVCRRFVGNHTEAFLFNFIGTILDTKRLENLPSRNLERIRKLHGDDGVAQALTMLELVNSGLENSGLNRFQLKTKAKLGVVWQFGKNLGLALRAHTPTEGSGVDSMAALGDVLLHDFSVDASHISLETEAARCILLLRGIISALANGENPNCSLFEKTAAFIVGTVIKHILRILQSLKYYDKTCNLGGSANKADMTRTKISELLAVYTEMFIASVSWILRETRHNSSQRWSSFLDKIYDDLILPVIRRQTVDLTIPFQQLLVMSKSVVEPRTRFEIPTAAPGLPGCSQNMFDLFNSVIRRSKQLLLARFRNRSVQSTLLEGVRNSKNSDEEAVSRIIGLSFAGVCSPDSISPAHDTPLQHDVDEDFMMDEESATDDLQRVRIEFLKIFVAPYLNQKQVNLEAKRKIIRMLVPMMSSDSNENPTSYLADDIEVLCSVAKSLRFSLVQCLANSAMDADFLSVFYACTSSFANVVILQGCDHEDTLIGWIRRILGQTTIASVNEISHEELLASYLWSFFKWLQKLGYFIITSDNHEGRKLGEFRQKCMDRYISQRDGAVSVWPRTVRSLMLEVRDLETWDGLLAQLEVKLFPSTKKIDTAIVNNYARRSDRKASVTPIQPWIPSAAVKRSAKEFIAEIIAVS